jgi:hypothetical protein
VHRSLPAHQNVKYQLLVIHVPDREILDAKPYRPIRSVATPTRRTFGFRKVE